MVSQKEKLTEVCNAAFRHFEATVTFRGTDLLSGVCVLKLWDQKEKRQKVWLRESSVNVNNNDTIMILI